MILRKFVYLWSAAIGFFLQLPCEAEWSQKDRMQEKEQLDLWQKKLSDSSNLQRAEKIEDLALGLRSMAFRKTFGDRDPRTDLIFSEIQHSMFQIPGYAEYFRDKIVSAQERLKNNEGYAPASDFLNEQMYGFQTLRQLPSYETVRVLGEMLSNDWVPPGNKNAGAAEIIPPLSELATGILTKFPIKNKPFNDRLTVKTLEDAHSAWQLWYEQIKSGNRTFRFEGDPTEYDLNGPAPKQTLSRIERSQKRDAERTEGHGKTLASTTTTTADSGPRQPTSHSVLIAAIGAMLASFAWYFGRKRIWGKS